MGSPVAQQIKRWPADLAVTGSKPAVSENLSNRKQGSTHSLSLSACYQPAMTVILKKGRKYASHSFVTLHCSRTDDIHYFRDGNQNAICVKFYMYIAVQDFFFLKKQ